MNENLEKLLKEISKNELFENTRYITEEIGERLSGTPGSYRMAEYLEKKLKEYSIKTNVHEFMGWISIPKSAELEILEPVKNSIKCSVFAHSATTLEEGIEKEIVYLGPGGEDRYINNDVKNKIVLVELSYSPPRPEKTRLAKENGASGIIMMNWGPKDNKSMPMGTIKWIWGNPNKKQKEDMKTIPAIGISKKDGEYLKELIEKKKVKLRMKTKATQEWKKLKQVSGEIIGNGPDKEEYIMVNGHMDGWAGGATDNASGNAAMLEIARILAKNKEKLNRSVKISFWAAHENGVMDGSTWYVDNYWQDIKNNLIAYINIDSPGMVGTNKRWLTYSTDEISNFHSEIEKEVLKKYEMKIDRTQLAKIGDQSVLGVGVPAMSVFSSYTQEEIKGWGGAIFAPFYHSTEDTMDKLDADILKMDVEVYLAYVFELSVRNILPFNYLENVDYYRKAIEKYKKFVNVENLLDDLYLSIKKFEGYINILNIQIQEYENKIGKYKIDTNDIKREKINECLKKISRNLTPAFKTVCGKYCQDTYGLSDLKKEIPRIADIFRLEEYRNTEEDYLLIKTSLNREVNYLIDAIEDSIVEIEKTIE